MMLIFTAVPFATSPMTMVPSPVRYFVATVGLKNADDSQLRENRREVSHGSL